MNQRSVQIFPLIMIGFLAALSFWLERIVDIPESRRDGKLRHDPDTIVENFMLRRFNSEGFLQSRLKAPHLLHYPDDESSLIQKPLYTYYRPSLPDTTISGEQARVTEKGKKVYLWGKVIANRAAAPSRPEMIVRTDDITIRPDDGIGNTDSPVEITQGLSRINGVGMDMDNNTSTFILRSRVTGILKRQKS